MLCIDDFEGVSSLDGSDILSIYSVRECFNLTLCGAEHAGVDVADSWRLKDMGKVQKIQMKLCRNNRGLMYANQSME